MFTIRTRIVLVGLAVALVCPAIARAATIELEGLLGSGVTATVSNYSLVGGTFSFDLSNTSASGHITNIGLALGDVTEATGFTTNSGFSYTLIHDGANNGIPGLRDNDFFLLASNAAIGIQPGQTFSYSFTGLTLDDGSPLSGFTADQLAAGIAPRFVGIAGPVTADIAAAVPEPTTLVLVGTACAALFGRARRRSRRDG